MILKLAVSGRLAIISSGAKLFDEESVALTY